MFSFTSVDRHCCALLLYRNFIKHFKTKRYQDIHFFFAHKHMYWSNRHIYNLQNQIKNKLNKKTNTLTTKDSNSQVNLTFYRAHVSGQAQDELIFISKINVLRNLYVLCLAEPFRLFLFCQQNKKNKTAYYDETELGVGRMLSSRHLNINCLARKFGWFHGTRYDWMMSISPQQSRLSTKTRRTWS